MNVERAQLGRTERIDSGAFGIVYRCNFRLAGDPTPLAYKEFTTDHAQQARAAESVIKLRANLSAQERVDLDRYTAWPRALVTDQGRVVGFLMPLLNPDFFCRLMDPATGGTRSAPRTIQWLIATPKKLRGARIDLGTVSLIDRQLLLAQLCFILGWLHKRGWIFGDLSFKNVAFALDPPRIMLIDCDGAAPRSDMARRQPHTPYWIPPECMDDSLQDSTTDVYKLALAIIRCLRPGNGAGTVTSARWLTGIFDEAGLILLERALGCDPHIRPRAKDLLVHLNDRVAPHVTPPCITHANLVGPVVVRGQDAVAEWQIRGATYLRVRVGSDVITLEPAQHAHGCTLPGIRSGRVWLTAGNRFGETEMCLGTLIVFDPPTLDTQALALPAVDLPVLPILHAVQLGALSLPALSTPVPAIPVLDWPTCLSGHLGIEVPAVDLTGLDCMMALATGVAETLASRARQFTALP